MMSRFLGAIIHAGGAYVVPGYERAAVLTSSGNGGLGRFLPCDVGKRVYEIERGVWQMENDDQRAKRLGRFRWRVSGGDSTVGALHAQNAPFAVEVEAATTAEAHEVARAARYAAGREHVHITAALPLLEG